MSKIIAIQNTSRFTTYIVLRSHYILNKTNYATTYYVDLQRNLKFLKGLLLPYHPFACVTANDYCYY